MKTNDIITILVVIYGLVKSMTNPWVFLCIVILIVASYPIVYMLTHRHDKKTFVHMLQWGREEEKAKPKKQIRSGKTKGKSKRK